MESLILSVHLLLAVLLVGAVLVQKSEGGMGSMGGGGAMGGMMSSRGAATFLTRMTALLAACFMLTSLALALAGRPAESTGSILDEAPAVADGDAPVQPSVPVE